MKNYHYSPYGTWKCKVCGCIFQSRSKLFKHHRTHPCFKGGKDWSKGLTKETCPSIALSAEACSKSQLERVHHLREVGLGHTLGRASTPELEDLRRKRISIAALNRTTPSVSKRTEPYTMKDGNVVNLDSSYERIVAKVLDEHEIDWIRPKPLEWFSADGVKHHYFPDFYLTKYDLYLDPKNDYCFKVQAEKISYVTEHYGNCVFLRKEQLTWDFIRTLLEKSHSTVDCSTVLTCQS